MKRSNIVEPNFTKWANNIIDDYLVTDYKFDEKTLGRLMNEIIERGLKQAYEQGYQLGLNKGWAIEQDKNNCEGIY